MQLKSVDDPCLQSESWIEVQGLDELEGAEREARRKNIYKVHQTLPLDQLLT